MKENNNKAKSKSKMSVTAMSKKVFTALVVILVILFVFDLVRSGQNGNTPWIGRYMQEHYPRLFIRSSSTSAAEISSYDLYAVTEAGRYTSRCMQSHFSLLDYPFQRSVMFTK